MSKGEKGFLALTIVFVVFVLISDGMRRAKASLNEEQRAHLSQIAETLKHTSRGDLIEMTDHRLFVVTRDSYSCSIYVIEAVGGMSQQRNFCATTTALLNVEKVITPQDSDYAPRLVAFVRGNQ